MEQSEFIKLLFIQKITSISFYSGAVKIADLLVKSKANLNMENIFGDTPLKVAKTSGLVYVQIFHLYYEYCMH